MIPTRKARIELTIPLPMPYANVKVSVEGEVQDLADYRKLLEDLGLQIDMLGNGDKEVHEALQFFKKRVLLRGEMTPVQAKTASAPTPPAKEPEKQGRLDGGEFEKPAEKKPAVVKDGPPHGFDQHTAEEEAAKAFKPKIIQQGAKDFKKASEVPKQTEPKNGIVDTVACENCRGNVEPAQAKISKTFAGRVLCKSCLDVVTEEKEKQMKSAKS